MAARKRISPGEILKCPPSLLMETRLRGYVI